MRFRHDAIRRAVERPGVAHAFWRDCSVDTEIGIEWLVSLGQRDALARIAHLLCEIATRNAVEKAETFDFDLVMTQGNIAEATGLSNVHVNRVLQTLRGRGLFSHVARRVHVLSWDGLQKAGDFDSRYLYLGGRDDKHVAAA